MALASAASSGSLDLSLRPASEADYAFYAELFPDLEIDTPMPSRSIWIEEFMSKIYIVTAGGSEARSIGFTMLHSMREIFYITNLMIAREWRQRGAGRTVLERLKSMGNAQGFKKWGLHCDIQHAIPHRLYCKVGMAVQQQLFHIRIPTESLLCFEALRDPRLVAVHAHDPKEWPDLEQKYSINSGYIEMHAKVGHIPVKLVDGLGLVVGFVIAYRRRRSYRGPFGDQPSYLPSLLHGVRQFEQIDADADDGCAHFWIEPQKETADYMLAKIGGAKLCEVFDYLEGSLC